MNVGLWINLAVAGVPSPIGSSQADPKRPFRAPEVPRYDVTGFTGKRRPLVGIVDQFFGVTNM